MTKLRSDLPPLPKRFTKLPVDARGYPVPAFVARVAGEYDFRIVKPGWPQHCYRHRRCWLCGEPLGRRAVFVIGPMCVVNRVTSEPPCHLDCAEFAARACPFLTKPMAVRNERDMPTDTINPAGDMIRRNPGCCALVTAVKWRVFDAHAGQPGKLIRIEDPVAVSWWAHGRTATRDEVWASIESGIPLLMGPAEAQGQAAVDELTRLINDAQTYLPAACPPPRHTPLSEPLQPATGQVTGCRGSHHYSHH